MDIRNVQRTGDMHYVYLPTAWCKEHKIGSSSKLSLELGGDGSLILSPRIKEKKPKHIELNIDETDQEVINKLIVSCYINPIDSFNINLTKKADFSQLLEQKRLLSVELVEFHGKQITCESSINISDPDLLLKTMISKIKNMVYIMIKNYNEELVQKYEEEIDRNRILIDKSVIGSLTFHRKSKIKTINLYYIAQIARDLERMADHLILLKKEDTKFLELVLDKIGALKDIIDIAVQNNGFDHKKVLDFTKTIVNLKEEKPTDLKSYYKIRIKHYFVSISEVLIDWAITKKIGN